jgi:hypothetical protein
MKGNIFFAAKSAEISLKKKYHNSIMINGLIESQNVLFSVIPAKAGIQLIQ